MFELGCTYSGQQIRRRNFSPKLQVFNTALMTAQANIGFEELIRNRELWGRWAGSAIGAYLLNQIIGRELGLYYWSKNNMEVDFVLVKGNKVTAIEAKSGASSVTLPVIMLFQTNSKSPGNCLSHSRHPPGRVPGNPGNSLAVSLY
jgi:hypothetical protein